MVNVSDISNPERDEVALYQNLRSIGSCEACWRTLNLRLFDRHPTVLRLDLHLENQQRVQFPAGTEHAVASSDPPKTRLTQWFLYVSENRHESHALTSTYNDFADTHTYYKNKKHRELKLSGGEVIGHMRTVHPKNRELFYLRTLLLHVQGRQLLLLDAPQESLPDVCTFEALKYFEGQKYETYQAACQARGLLQDDSEWHAVLDDAIFTQINACSIRQLFLYIIRFNSPSDPQALFDAHHSQMADDLAREAQQQLGSPSLQPAELRALLLHSLQIELSHFGETLQGHQLVQTPTELQLAQQLTARCSEPRLIQEELYTNRAELAESGNRSAKNIVS